MPPRRRLRRLRRRPPSTMSASACAALLAAAAASSSSTTAAGAAAASVSGRAFVVASRVAGRTSSSAAATSAAASAFVVSRRSAASSSGGRFCIGGTTTRTAPRRFGPASSLAASTSTTTTLRSAPLPSAPSASSTPPPPMKINLQTISKTDLEDLLVSWGHPKYRASQILKWIRDAGASTFDEMTNLPASLRSDLRDRAKIGSLEVAAEWKSSDGTIKRAYRLWDGQLIESVLMPYDDGRITACISSQAGCAMGCVFCATGQMGFARQLTSDEIFEQAASLASEVKRSGDGDDDGSRKGGKGKSKRRLTNVVMMGMGEPLANYRNVMEAVRRMNDELGIGARKITVSTVGIVPNIRKLAQESLQVRLAVSLHCSSDEERTALLPANRRYGGIDELLGAVREYVETTRRRVTFEWALIEGQNDTPEVARSLGKLLGRHGLRRDMCHVNVIPLNPTGGFGGSPSGRRRVAKFVEVLEDEFGIGATPRMRRGIDIDAGCGQLKAAVMKKEGGGEEGGDDGDGSEPSGAGDELRSFIEQAAAPTLSTADPPIVGVFEDEVEYDDVLDETSPPPGPPSSSNRLVDFSLDDAVLDLDEHEGEVIDDDFDAEEAERLISLVEASFPAPPPPAAQAVGDAAEKERKTETMETMSKTKEAAPATTTATTTTITDEGAVRDAKRRRKKLLKNLRMIDRLRQMESEGRTLNDEQRIKVEKEERWRAEVESLEHNLQ